MTTTTTALEPPLLEVTDPIDGAVVSSRRYTFRGRTEPGCTVDIGGRYFADVDADGNWTLELILVPGGNTTTFTATDEAGLSSTAQVNVVFAEEPTTTSTTPDLTPPERPKACDATPQGITTFPDKATYEEVLVGQWLLCDITRPGDLDGPLGIAIEGVIGVEILPEDRYRHLTGPVDAPVALTGWGNEGTYSVWDNMNIDIWIWPISVMP